MLATSRGLCRDIKGGALGWLKRSGCDHGGACQAGKPEELSAAHDAG
jgi:hypothetical protein